MSIGSLKTGVGLPKVLLMLGGLVFALIASELGFRVAYVLQGTANPRKAVLSDDWGWKSTPDLDISYETKGYGHIEYSTDPEGFRVMGNIDTDRVKVFVVGDSFTQGYHVSDGKTYYHYLAKHDDRIEVFAYGVGGYATLQEALVLEEYLERIDPDIVIWQFHSNDLIGSDARLESASTENNNHMVRPYLESEEVLLRHPDGVLGKLAIRSVLARRLAILRSSVMKRMRGTVETELHPEHPELERAVATMKASVTRVLEAHRGRVFIAFQVPEWEPRGYEETVFARICELEKLRCFSGVGQALERRRSEGVVIDGGADRHWSVDGHATVGQALLDYLQSSELLPVSGESPDSPSD